MLLPDLTQNRSIDRSRWPSGLDLMLPRGADAAPGSRYRRNRDGARRCARCALAQIELITTFADQAVIAIENVRPVQGASEARTADLTRSVGELTRARRRRSGAQLDARSGHGAPHDRDRRANQLAGTDAARSSSMTRSRRVSSCARAATDPARRQTLDASAGHANSQGRAPSGRATWSQRAPSHVPDIAVEGATTTPIAAPPLQARLSPQSWQSRCSWRSGSSVPSA